MKGTDTLFRVTGRFCPSLEHEIRKHVIDLLAGKHEAYQKCEVPLFTSGRWILDEKHSRVAVCTNGWFVYETTMPYRLDAYKIEFLTWLKRYVTFTNLTPNILDLRPFNDTFGCMGLDHEGRLKEWPIMNAYGATDFDMLSKCLKTHQHSDFLGMKMD